MDGWAAHPMGWGGDGVVASPVEAPGVSLIARRCLSGATPRGQSWTSAGLLPHGRNGLNAQRMAVVSTFREPSLCRHVPRELWRSVWLDLPPIIAVTACHQRNCVERYSRFKAEHKQCGHDQADEPGAACLCLPQRRLRVAVSAIDRLPVSMHATFGKPSVIRQAPDALLPVLTNRIENDNALGPQSHGVGPYSGG